MSDIKHTKEFKAFLGITEQNASIARYALQSVAHQIQQNAAQLEQWKTQLEQLETQREQMQPQLEQIQTQHEQVDFQLEQLETQLEQLETQLEQIQTQHEQGNSQLKPIQTRLEQIRTQIEQVLAQSEQLQTGREQVLAQSEQMRTDYEKMRTKREQWKSQYELLQKQSEPAFGPDIRRWWTEVLICRYVDAFEYYISQILRRVFIHCPDLLKGSDTKMRGTSDNKVEVREVLEAGSISEFIQRYADKKVYDLSYRGLENLVEYLNSNLGLKIDTNLPAFQYVLYMTEVRNIIVHNAGRINKIFSQRTGRKDLQIGDLYPIQFIEFNQGKLDKFEELAEEIDTQIVSKFKLTDDEQTVSIIIHTN